MKSWHQEVVWPRPVLAIVLARTVDVGPGALSPIPVPGSGSEGPGHGKAICAKLVEELGATDYRDRQRCRKDQLEALGEPALEALRKAAADHADPEVQVACRSA